MDSLKPCPFCGSRDLGCAPLFRPLPDFEDDGNQWVVQCRSCKTRFVTRSMTKAELYEYWNRRGSDG